ncbi:restriction endonuclease [Streptomyces sp. NPDC005811]|uniref:restriction endonuclease n=1 Tax=Streptomyces sp. NPDC005811 TaxID=3154565 RepID=UPI0033E7752A
MPKAGRGLEELVATLEEILADSAVEVRSPDHIDGKSGSSREVDVSLRARVGSVEVLVILECRDRGRSQDIEWIDQLIGKRDDVGASKAVAVSRAGFTSGAQKRAEQGAIELRTLDSVTRETVWGWVGVEFATATVRQFDIKRAQICIPTAVPEKIRLAAQRVISGKLQIDAPILVRTTDETPVSLGDVWREAPKPAELDSLTPGIPKRGTLHVVPGDPDESSAWYAIPTEFGQVRISEIVLTGDFRIDQRRIPVSRSVYRSADTSFVEIAHVDVRHKQEVVRMGLHSTLDGSKVVVIDNPGGVAFQADLLFKVIDEGESPVHGN